MSSLNIAQADAPKYECEYVEFDCRIYAGEEIGFIEAVTLAPNLPVSTSRPECISYWVNDKYWEFVFKGGHVCSVNNNRVRFVKSRIPSEMKTKNESGGVAIDEGVADGIEETVHTEESAPKRRGRPPKAKPE